MIYYWLMIGFILFPTVFANWVSRFSFKYRKKRPNKEEKQIYKQSYSFWERVLMLPLKNDRKFKAVFYLNYLFVFATVINLLVFILFNDNLQMFRLSFIIWAVIDVCTLSVSANKFFTV